MEEKGLTVYEFSSENCLTKDKGSANANIAAKHGITGISFNFTAKSGGKTLTSGQIRGVSFKSIIHIIIIMITLKKKLPVQLKKNNHFQSQNME